MSEQPKPGSVTPSPVQPDQFALALTASIEEFLQNTEYKWTNRDVANALAGVYGWFVAKLYLEGRVKFKPPPT